VLRAKPTAAKLVAANGGEQRDSNIYELKKKGCDFFVSDEEQGVKIYVDTDNESR
jgi:hypothetical protein